MGHIVVVTQRLHSMSTYYMQECACIEHTVRNFLERQKGKLQYFAQVKYNSYRDTPHLCQQIS